MDAIMGMGVRVWFLAIVVIGFCLVISPLMIWKHTKATSQKLEKLIKLVAEKK
ncbi:MAG: hypothetical protein KAI70_02820 [Candidatus Omnitrophica bacterium]|nr:hypothetical protein [Candidatus Omnitrophota bacterium]